MKRQKHFYHIRRVAQPPITRLIIQITRTVQCFFSFKTHTHS